MEGSEEALRKIPEAQEDTHRWRGERDAGWHKPVMAVFGGVPVLVPMSQMLVAVIIIGPDLSTAALVLVALVAGVATWGAVFVHPRLGGGARPYISVGLTLGLMYEGWLIRFSWDVVELSDPASLMVSLLAIWVLLGPPLCSAYYIMRYVHARLGEAAAKPRSGPPS